MRGAQSQSVWRQMGRGTRIEHGVPDPRAVRAAGGGADGSDPARLARGWLERSEKKKWKEKTEKKTVQHNIPHGCANWISNNAAALYPVLVNRRRRQVEKFVRRVFRRGWLVWRGELRKRSYSRPNKPGIWLLLRL